LLTRRTFIRAAAGAIAASQMRSKLFAKPRPQKLLVLGGTNFLGPAIVERALEAGHQVTLFNRGKTNPGLFPNIEKIRGDRETNNEGGISALSGTRRWDAVIDVWPSEPRTVMPTARLLADRTDFYSFVSSIGAYADTSHPGTEESAPLAVNAPGYSGEKARSETELGLLLGTKLGIVRPCPIAGPRDNSLSFHYWLTRLRQDRPIIAPGDGTSPVEIVDVRDVADWVLQNVEARRPGVYNVCGQEITFRTFLDECKSAIHGQAHLVSVDQQFLLKEGVSASAGNLPFWSPDNPGFQQVSSQKARRAGWVTRPLGQTAVDAWNFYRTWVDPNIKYPQHQWRYDWGISAERQAQILRKWEENQANSHRGSEAATA
jgi:2'-hydroxyisoflavone reductase